jgi:hypothetical protein
MFKYTITKNDGSSRVVEITEYFRRWPMPKMEVGETITIYEDPTMWGQAQRAAHANVCTFKTKTIRNRDGYFRHGIITRIS